VKQPTAAVLTTGCRLNQSESDALRQRLLLQGVSLVEGPEVADCCYVNTCTVTAAADRSSMQAIHRACRAGSRPRVVVLGCLAERDPERVQEVSGVSEVWDNQKKQRELEGLCPSPGRSRALLKVQDGCARRCSYCVVSSLRGKPQSVPVERVVAQFECLLAQGFGEVVLTGLNLGTYRDGGTDLAGLVSQLLGRCGSGRIRLGSVEPDTVTDALLDLLGDRRLCPHLHLPLQSGDDAVLTLMQRPYCADDFRELLSRVLAVRPEACIGCDVIAGFPGEDTQSFDRTTQFLDSVSFSYLHVFPFSRRPGTENRLTGRASGHAEVRERMRVLRRLSESRRRAYESRFVGSTRQAVVESSRNALTDNYLRLAVSGGRELPARALAEFRIGEEAGRMTGCPC
jgi:threonylcarbamoyladenosine tRNA methylthiotransferase MtaB